MFESNNDGIRQKEPRQCNLLRIIISFIYANESVLTQNQPDRPALEWILEPVHLMQYLLQGQWQQEYS